MRPHGSPEGRISAHGTKTGAPHLRTTKTAPYGGCSALLNPPRVEARSLLRNSCARVQASVAVSVPVPLSASASIFCVLVSAPF
eukprot:5156920-Pleurochrysis_carterae.AAC.2